MRPVTTSAKAKAAHGATAASAALRQGYGSASRPGEGTPYEIPPQSLWAAAQLKPPSARARHCLQYSRRAAARREYWPITFYTQQAETIRLVEEQLAAAACDSQPAQEGAAASISDAEQDCAGGGDAMRIARYRNTRYWAVIDTEDTLVCLCVYRKGALEVVRRLQARTIA